MNTFFSDLIGIYYYNYEIIVNESKNNILRGRLLLTLILIKAFLS